LNDEATKAEISRRSLLLAGTALPVLSVASCGLQLQQAQGQPSSSQSAPAAAGNAVAVAPSDTIVAIQAKLNSVPTGGTLEFPANSVFNFNSHTVRGKPGITVLAKGPVIINGAPGPATAGAFDFGGMSSWTLRGRAPGQGFVFNNTLVNADGSKQGAVGHCVFNNIASNGLNGSAIRMTGASFLLVINNDFNGCQGNVLGQYDWDNIRLDGNHFTNCWQPVSINQGPDRTIDCAAGTGSPVNCILPESNACAIRVPSRLKRRRPVEPSPGAKAAAVDPASTRLRSFAFFESREPQ